MEVRHDDDDLANAERDPAYKGALDHKLVRALIKVMTIVRGVRNETHLYQHRGLRFKQCKGNRAHQHELRLNDQFRLIVEIEKRDGRDVNICAIKELVDIHDEPRGK